MAQELSVADCLRQSRVSQDAKANGLSEDVSLSNTFILSSDEIQRIVKVSIEDHITEIEQNFRWVTVDNEKEKILQFCSGNYNYHNIAFISRSKLPKAGLGLFTACDLPKGTTLFIYLGRHVKKNNLLRQYIMELPRKFVRKSKWDDRWERRSTGCNGTIVDALIFDEYYRWTMK